MRKHDLVVPVARIQKSIFLFRGQKVLLDMDLAEFYGVETRSLIQAVKRNIERFPSDFVFQLDWDEFDSLRSQIVISKGKGGRCGQAKRGLFLSGEVFFSLTCPLMGDPLTAES